MTKSRKRKRKDEPMVREVDARGNYLRTVPAREYYGDLRRARAEAENRIARAMLGNPYCCELHLRHPKRGVA